MVAEVSDDPGRGSGAVGILEPAPQLGLGGARGELQEAVQGKDLEEVATEVRETMKFILVDHIDEAIEAGLRPVADGFDPADSGVDRLLNQPGAELLTETAV